MDNEKIVEVMKNIDAIVNQKIKKSSWVTSAAIALFELSQTLREVKEKKEADCRSLKIKLDLLTEPYQVVINELTKKDKSVREVLLKNYAGDGLVIDGMGEIIIKHPWTHDVLDMKQVPAEYLCVDTAKVSAAIKEGVRNIPGIVIKPGRSITVMPAKSI
jgi:hypothetical protein